MRSLLEHWEREAAAGRLAIQHCAACGRVQAVPRPFCSGCGAAEPAWRTAAGRGVVVAHSVLHRAPTPAWRERLPYAVALVALEEGPRVMGHAPLALALGTWVTLSFAARDGRHLLRFDSLTAEAP